MIPYVGGRVPVRETLNLSRRHSEVGWLVPFLAAFNFPSVATRYPFATGWTVGEHPIYDPRVRLEPSMLCSAIKRSNHLATRRYNLFTTLMNWSIVGFLICDCYISKPKASLSISLLRQVIFVTLFAFWYFAFDAISWPTQRKYEHSKTVDFLENDYLMLTVYLFPLFVYFSRLCFYERDLLVVPMPLLRSIKTTAVL